jgi:hypothetical protein
MVSLADSRVDAQTPASLMARVSAGSGVNFNVAAGVKAAIGRRIAAFARLEKGGVTANCKADVPGTCNPPSDNFETFAAGVRVRSRNRSAPYVDAGIGWIAWSERYSELLATAETGVSLSLTPRVRAEFGAQLDHTFRHVKYNMVRGTVGLGVAVGPPPFP